MKNTHYIWQVDVPDYIHGRAFDEISLSLSRSFLELGYHAPVHYVDEFSPQRTAIIVGANLLADYEYIFTGRDERFIFYNLEQISVGSPWMTPNYLKLLQKGRVWDYSLANIAALRQLGIEAEHCEIGYTPALTRIPATPVQDIDVLFFGSTNPRRIVILDRLRALGFKVECLYGVYGKQRDDYIARAKIVINIHYYESKVFEIVRCSYLMANRKFVISETGADRETEDYYAPGIVFSEYDQLVDTCVKYLNAPYDRLVRAERGFALFKEKSQSQILKALI